MIQDDYPGPGFFSIPDPGLRGQKSAGSGSATRCQEHLNWCPVPGFLREKVASLMWNFFDKKGMKVLAFLPETVPY
jgi:hypothetical protein